MDATHDKNENTAQRLAERLRQATRGSRAANAIPRRPSSGPGPLSFSQEGLWLVERARPGTPLYNIAWAVRLRGTLDVEALRRALETVVARHDGLRMRFVEVDGQPVQEALPLSETPLDFTVVDLCGLAEEARESAALAHATEACVRPFDLTRPPLVRSLLCRLSPEHHLWALTLHHIVGDGPSQAIIMREASAAYQVLVENRPLGGAEAPIGLADHAAWQRDQQERGCFGEALAWWVERLAGAPSLLELPCDRPRPATCTHHGATLTRQLPEALATRLRHIAQDAGSTLYVVLLSAFAVLLHRWTGEHDLVIGTPLSGRDDLETHHLVGYLVDMQPLRIDCSASQEFRALVKEVSRITRQARAHQGVPFSRIVEALQPERAANRHAIFQVVFSMRGDDPSFDAPPIEAEPMPMGTGTAKFDLTFEIADTTGDLATALEYSTDLFDDSTIVALWERFTRLVACICDNADIPIGDLPFLSEEEERRVLVEINPPLRAAPPVACLHQLFERQAAATPSAIAVSCGSDELTYQALNARAERIAGQLRLLGVGPGTCVPFTLQRSVDQVAVMLGILKSGGAYVYFDPNYPAERLAFMRDDCGAPLTVTETAFLERIPWTCAVLLDEDGQLSPPLLAGDALPASDPHGTRPSPSASSWEPPSADTLAYVTYTSGSTGRPKGVAIPHRAVVSFLDAMKDEDWLGSLDVLAAVSALSFDFHVLETWLPLLTGAEVVLVPREVAADGRALRALVEKRGVTAMGATPATFRLLLEAGWQGDPRFKIHIGGEAMPTDLVDALLDRSASVHNAYGPTETAVYATLHAVRRGEQPVPIGRPLRNTRVYVVDEQDRLVPPGVWGELLIGGQGVALGYLNRPSLTAERFIENPFAAREHALGLNAPPRLYRSGDLARFRQDGTLEFRGRIDSQVKIRGFRIELGEIEAVLCGHPQVRQAVVTVHGQDQDARLVGYLVGDGTNLDTDDVRTHVARLLPPFMCPAALVRLERLPLTTTGKLDRRALPVPSPEAFRMAGTPSQPRTPTENRLAALWAEVLGLPRVGVHDSFFHLGGHSMLAARLFIRLRDEMGHDLPLAALFQAPTPAEMARLLDGPTLVARSTLVPIQTEGHRPPFFWLHTLGGGGGGGLLRYRELARRLGPAQPSYGLEAPREPFDTLEEMAAAYIEVMREVQPRGPYHLGGFCFGGVVAYEIACQLERTGHSVGLLTLIDSHVPALWQPSSALTRMRRFLSKPLRDQVAQVRRVLLRLSRWTRRLPEDALIPLEDVVDITIYPEEFVQYARVHWDALQRYRPTRYHGRIDLFTLAEFVDQARREWGSLCGEGVRIHLAEGTHETAMEEPHVERLARVLAPLLEARQQEEASAQAQREEATP